MNAYKRENSDLKKAYLAIFAFMMVFSIVLFSLFFIPFAIGFTHSGLIKIVCWIMATIFLIVLVIGLIPCLKRLNAISIQIMLNKINKNLKDLGFTISEIKERQKELSQHRRSQLKCINRNLNQYKEGKIKQSDISEKEFYKPLIRN